MTEIHSSNNSGDFVVLNRLNYNEVEIEFVDTGGRRTVSAGSIRRGEVLDKMKPSREGVGFIGVGKYKSSIKGINTKCYQTWSDMLRRCYNAVLHKKFPTYKDCTVCTSWLNFQNFASWFDLNYIEGCELDKDLRVAGNKVYSPSTCMFVTQAENSAKGARV